MKRFLAVLVIGLLFSCVKKTEKEPEVPKQLPVVVTVNYPLYYFADRIGADLIDLKYLIPENVDPAYWTPGQTELEKFQAAEVIYKNGADYAKWMNNVSLPSSKVVNTLSGVKNKLIKTENMKTHSHGPEGEHQHAELAFTTWLDFELSLEQAEVIKSDLEKRIPEEALKINENFKKLKLDLTSIHNEMLNASSQFENQLLVASHPVYQYLEKAYGLEIASVHFEPDQMPTKKQWHGLEHLFHRKAKKMMLWEDEPNEDIRAELEKRGIRIIVFKPCGNRPVEGDFLTTMQDNIKHLKEVVSD